MLVMNSIEKWFARFRPYIFAHKKGFFELHYLSNSPQVMIGAFKKIPFVKYDTQKQFIAANTLFLNVLFYYREIEEELFILCSETKFKANITFKHYYDKAIPANYYCLSLRLDHYSKAINSIVNDTSFPDDSCLLFKPGAKVSHHHFKGTTGRYITVYFTNHWLENYLQHTNKEAKKEWEAFINSDSDHLICPHLIGNKIFDEKNLFKLFFEQDEFKGDNYIEALKSETLNLLSFFGAQMRAVNLNKKHFLVSNRERMAVLQAEQILIEHLYEKFPGINFIATKTGLSETKLKECFKTVYDATLFQYFQNIQLKKAKELISTGKFKIAEVSIKMCYQNASKFAAVFKDQFGMQPSALIKE
jgi:AraC-like DNA-binding protein